MKTELSGLTSKNAPVILRVYDQHKSCQVMILNQNDGIKESFTLTKNQLMILFLAME